MAAWELMLASNGRVWLVLPLHLLSLIYCFCRLLVGSLCNLVFAMAQKEAQAFPAARFILAYLALPYLS